MGTLSRLRYVISANLNALIEKAEDPQKMLRALVREMEDALGEARAASVALIAEHKRIERHVENLNQSVDDWQVRAEKALEKDKEDLAREALTAKAKIAEESSHLEQENEHLKTRIAQVDRDMGALRGKLHEARARLREYDKPAAAVRRAAPSRTDRRLEKVFSRFENLESQMENLEARVESYDLGSRPDLEEQFTDMKVNESVEKELEELKARVQSAA